MKPTHMISAVLGVILLYPLSFGPVVWISNSMRHSSELDSFGIEFYAPLVGLAERNPTTCRLLIWYQFLVS
jgi:hypothetical protein